LGQGVGVAVDFEVRDARKRLPGKAFDFIIWLYDVIGSYRTLKNNALYPRSKRIRGREDSLCSCWLF
jgi:hypothetical protein